jgi:hypothetical protein
MMWRFGAAAVVCGFTAGCVTLPTEQNDGVSINRVSDRVKCELGQAVASNPKLLSWAAVITLTLEVDQTGSVLPSTSLTGPFNAGTYAVNATAGATGTSIQTSLVTAYFPIWQVEKFAEHCPLSPATQLEDSLGLKEWVVRSLDAGAEEGLVFNDKSKAVGYTIEFDLELTAGITPGFIFTRVSGQTGLSADRKTKHTLDIAMTDAGLSPPRKVVTFRPAKSSGENLAPGAPSPPPERIVVVTKPKPVGDDTRRRLDAIMQQLLLKNLRRQGF